MKRNASFIPAITVSVLFGFQSVSAQFKINIPKIPKVTKEKPVEPEKPSATVSTSSNSSRSSSSTSKSTIPGAKMYFSNTPFTSSNAGAKTTFTSSEFIYGRLELNQTVYDAFGLSALGERNYYYIYYDLGTERTQERDRYSDPVEWNGSRNLYLTKEDVQKKYLNFDVLPDPNNMTTVLAQVDELDKYFIPAHFGGMIEFGQAKFPQNGDYPITIKLHQNAFDAWGKPISVSDDKMPSVINTFTFKFDIAKDAKNIISNYKIASQNAGNAATKREAYQTMPDWWAKGAAPKDALLQPAALTPMLKNWAGGGYLKHMVEAYSILWTIQTNDLGIPRYRNSPAIWVIYKSKTNAEICGIQALWLQQDYIGGGRYGASYLRDYPKQYSIYCAAVK